MCAEVLALIGDVVSLPYGALSLPLSLTARRLVDISVLSRAVFCLRVLSLLLCEPLRRRSLLFD